MQRFMHFYCEKLFVASIFIAKNYLWPETGTLLVTSMVWSKHWAVSPHATWHNFYQSRSFVYKLVLHDYIDTTVNQRGIKYLGSR